MISKRFVCISFWRSCLSFRSPWFHLIIVFVERWFSHCIFHLRVSLWSFKCDFVNLIYQCSDVLIIVCNLGFGRRSWTRPLVWIVEAQVPILFRDCSCASIIHAFWWNYAWNVYSRCLRSRLCWIRSRCLRGQTWLPVLDYFGEIIVLESRCLVSRTFIQVIAPIPQWSIQFVSYSSCFCFCWRENSRTISRARCQENLVSAHVKSCRGRSGFLLACPVLDTSAWPIIWGWTLSIKQRLSILSQAQQAAD